MAKRKTSSRKTTKRTSSSRSRTAKRRTSTKSSTSRRSSGNTKLIKKGDRIRPAKYRASLKKSGATITQIKELTAKFRSYVSRTANPSSLGVRKFTEAYLRKNNQKAYAKYHSYRKSVSYRRRG